MVADHFVKRLRRSDLNPLKPRLKSNSDFKKKLGLLIMLHNQSLMFSIIIWKRSTFVSQNTSRSSVLYLFEGVGAG